MTDVPILAADFETRSKASIKDLGGRLYTAHPSTSMVCAVFAFQTDRGWAYHETTDTAWPWGNVGVFDLMAHNGAQFDIHVWRRLGWPEPRRVIDTAQLARRAGFPQASLEWIGESFLGMPKDMEGNKLMKSLSRLVSRGDRKGEYAIDPIPADILAAVVAYCRRDVEVMVTAWDRYLQHWDRLSPLEDAVLALDTLVNDRGIHFDRGLAEAILHVDAGLASRSLAAAGLTDPTDVRGNQRFLGALAAMGVQLPNAQKATVQALAEDDTAPEAARALAQARLSGNTIAGGKLEVGLAQSALDGILHDMYRYGGAHTLRWSGQKLQPQNLPA